MDILYTFPERFQVSNRLFRLAMKQRLTKKRNVLLTVFCRPRGMLYIREILRQYLD